MKSPRQVLLCIQETIIDTLKNNNDVTLTKFLTNSKYDIQIGFEGSFGQNSVSPRGLSSTFLNQLIEVEGMYECMYLFIPHYDIVRMP